MTDDILVILFLFFGEKNACCFSWIVLIVDNSYEMSSLIFSENTKKKKNVLLVWLCLLGEKPK